MQVKTNWSKNNFLIGACCERYTLSPGPMLVCLRAGRMLWEHILPLQQTAFKILAPWGVASYTLKNAGSLHSLSCFLLLDSLFPVCEERTVWDGDL